MPQVFDQIEAAVDAVLARIPGDIVLGTPLGIGKPNPFLNALYQRIKADPKRKLKIITALSLQKPVSGSDIERRFLEPFVARVFGDYPDLDYVKDLRAGSLPANVEVLEFFLKTGDYLGNQAAQQNYISTNYTFAARDIALHGVNLIAQAVAQCETQSGPRWSLSSNPDLTYELAERLAVRDGHPLIAVGVVNKSMPYMSGQAEVPADFFDLIITDPAGSHDLFAPPNMKVSLQDYAIGLHASSLVADGGTLQIGIGALGDAIAQALIVRYRYGEAYKALLSALCNGDLTGRELGTFEQGLYGCSEMLVNGLLALLEAGILRREVYADASLQSLVNAGRIGEQPDTGALVALHQAGRLASPLRADDLAFLQTFGLLKPTVTYEAGKLCWQGRQYTADLNDPAALAAIGRDLLGERLLGGVVLHGGFFLGPRDFYQRLRDMSDEQRRKIEMHRIDFINQLYGPNGSLAVAQRGKARFMNTAMIVTLLGAAVSDGLDTGQVVSGVGGQYNFVAMSHALPDARSILMLRATREHKGELHSNIVWNYGHTTIPRHLRDVVVTEYGVADLRGQPDAEVIKRLLAVADSRFQNELMLKAMFNGKLEADYVLPESQRNNLPERLATQLAPFQAKGLLPDFPFGTDFTADELAIIDALQKLRQAADSPLELLGMALKSLFADKEAPTGYLERLGLDEARDLKSLVMRRLFVGNL
ncbi:acetyl-CoA hydrolase/transferase C-terminal domain-containing protein [Chitinimonas sp. BJB300]|uniref:acetyl-CoA hydrolase/transferase C-terminal domain-containing protein n=1 Tax=Chitinimonas sp. BJB300 TaxID=1559339 RepID=UPI000C0CC94B|nr:acetyl-CoA hydrolase/transferase C-terminal domain-containing protein [Chitinimonas sp. BJB300]PHV11228.1 acetyl-CoA hydrolase [Chitinimonas sp. BJB300]TSJ87387.1 acetyl-CoA hydrolase/transferase family protein [Chitinimonas sp. BJB300]